MGELPRLELVGQVTSFGEGGIRSMDLKILALPGVQTVALPFPGCVILDKLLNLEP